ncbi:sarcosine oxidase subunit gamma [Sphingomonas bacterium]|uniref:sarcosine oxidase subunit gamma n=1 Tax=Sphingomonas bacterium TaxID=1895847 RepID=UPI00157546E0|nr:sarcosine oxidase subunit gamma family protein [Sphingomonas bacterium]
MPDSLTVEPRDRLGIASVMARKGIASAAIGTRLGIEMSDRPRAIVTGGRTVVGTGPGTWLLIEEDAAPDFTETLQQVLAGLAGVSDQSSGYVVQRFSGPGARTLLKRGAAIDFDTEAFATGSAATTVIAHIGVILWQVDDRPSYDVATFRSYAHSFRHWVDETAAAL